MSISSVAAAQSAQTVAQSASDKAAASLSENYTMFLTLLTTQLKNQNPLDPMKSETFTQQLVQMSSVEQSIQTNKNLETLISASAFQAANTAVDLIGKEIDAVGAGATLKDGAAKWNITLASAAPDTTVQVLDKNGATVYTAALNGKSGSQSFTWNGKDASGNQLDDGTYFLQVTANDANGEAVGGTVTARGIVTAVDIASSNPVITVNGTQVKYSDVTSIANPS